MTIKSTQKVSTGSNQLVFPDDFPPGVPPNNALDADGTFYRIATANPPGEKCFLNMKEENPKRMKKFKGLALKCCYGVSMFLDETSLLNAFDKFPEGIGERFIAKGSLNAKDGKMLKTGAPDSTHFTIWLYNTVKLHQKFTFVRGVTK